MMGAYRMIGSYVKAIAPLSVQTNYEDHMLRLAPKHFAVCQPLI